jgi:hypothetical protein
MPTSGRRMQRRPRSVVCGWSAIRGPVLGIRIAIAAALWPVARPTRWRSWMRSVWRGSTRSEDPGADRTRSPARRLPERVIAVATIAGVAPADGEGLDWLAGMGEENVEEFEAVRAGPEALEEFINRWAPDLRTVTGEQVLAELGQLVSPPDAEVLTGDYAEFVAGELREALRSGIWGWFDDDVAILGDWGFDLDRIEVPVRIWHGRDDRFVPVAHGLWLAEHVAGATAHILDGHGHLSLALGHFGEILDDLRAAN